jgi:hypothetical protein
MRNRPILEQDMQECEFIASFELAFRCATLLPDPQRAVPRPLDGCGKTLSPVFVQVPARLQPDHSLATSRRVGATGLKCLVRHACGYNCTRSLVGTCMPRVKGVVRFFVCMRIHLTQMIDEIVLRPTPMCADISSDCICAYAVTWLLICHDYTRVASARFIASMRADAFVCIHTLENSMQGPCARASP